jgi:hypothetical protein
MHQPVDQGRGQGVVHFKEYALFPKGTIRGDHDRSNFITGGENLEQQIGATLVDGQIDQLNEEETDTTVATFTGSADRSMIVQAAYGHNGGTQAALSIQRFRQQPSASTALSWPVMSSSRAELIESRGGAPAPSETTCRT